VETCCAFRFFPGLLAGAGTSNARLGEFRARRDKLNAVLRKVSLFDFRSISGDAN
jgi:hypothetical protein